jgi:hypothetical protein
VVSRTACPRSINVSYPVAKAMTHHCVSTFVERTSRVKLNEGEG